MTDTDFLASLPRPINLHTSATPADVSEAIRSDLKSAVEAGLIPSHAKFSVRREDYKSICVDLVAWHGQVLDEDYASTMRDHVLAHLASKSTKELPAFEWGGLLIDQRTRRQSQDNRLIATINDVLGLVERIADRHNYDNSDIQTDYFDVGYYLHISARKLLSVAERGIQLECDPAAQALLTRAQAAARRVGAKVVKSVCGVGGVECCSQRALEQLLKLDAAANGRPLTYDKRRGRWVVAEGQRATQEDS